MAEPPRGRILHVDVDAMFVQCAVMAEPERLGGERLILVGGSPTGRGVVTSASYGCREFGVHSAMPMATALRLCPRAVVVPVPGEMIRRKSRELKAALEGWAPVAVMASVDEAYLDLTGTEALYHGESLESTARRIQADLRARTGLDVSLGGGTNRLVAKLATSFAKPAGVYIVAPGEEAEFVGRLRLDQLIGVGPAMLAALRRRGVSTIAALRALDRATMAQWWGADRAESLWRRCRGIDDTPVKAREVARTISSETTFPRDVAEPEEIQRALLAQVVDAAHSMRKRGLFARTISVKLRSSDFRDRSRSRTVADPVQTDRVIHQIARELLRDLLVDGSRAYRLVGVTLSTLSREGDHAQRSLLDVAPPLEPERERALASAVDRIRAKHGQVIGPASVAGTRRRRHDSD